MKKYTLYILSISLLLFTSCEDQLDEVVPRSQLTYNGFWDNEDGANAAHTGLYTNFRNEAFDFNILGELRSDVWGGSTFESPSNVGVIENNISATQVPWSRWAGFYTRIHRINDFIENVPNIAFGNEANKAHMMGQVYGMRAFYYYTMLKAWGQVPIITETLKEVDPSGISKERSPETDVMALVKSDLQASLTQFGNDDSQWQENGSHIYWSKAATLALKGDVFIWSGKHLGGGNADYTTAVTTLQSISGHSLETNYADAFSNESSSETIFAFDYQQDQAGNFYGSQTGRTTEIHPLYLDNSDSMSEFVANGANRYGPSDKVLLATDDNLDSRKAATFKRLFKNDNDGAGYPTFDAANYVGSITNKFLGRVTAGSRIMDNNVPLYRYADVILLIAEAKNNLGQDPSSEINQIRMRAYGANYVPATHAYVNGSAVANTNAILQERLKEFLTEGKRWWDLRRAGDEFVFQEVQYVDQAYQLLLPITDDMIGRNPLLIQTSGYEQ